MLTPYRPAAATNKSFEMHLLPGITFDLVPVRERRDPIRMILKIQLTNRRSRTMFTSPSIRNVDKVLDPPELISGNGMPVTGILPTTIPTFTNR